MKIELIQFVANIVLITALLSMLISFVFAIIADIRKKIRKEETNVFEKIFLIIAFSSIGCLTIYSVLALILRA